MIKKLNISDRLLLHACCGPCSIEPVRLLQEQGIRPSIYFANSNIYPQKEYTRRLDTLLKWAQNRENVRHPLPVIEGHYLPHNWESAQKNALEEYIGTPAKTKRTSTQEQDERASTPAQNENITMLQEWRSALERALAKTSSTQEQDERASTPAQTNRTSEKQQTENASTPSWSELIRQIQNETPTQTQIKELDALRQIRCRTCYRMRFQEAAKYAASHNFTALSSTLPISPYQYTKIIQEELERAAQANNIKAYFQDWRPYYQNATRSSRALGMYRQNYCGCYLSQIEADIQRKQRKEQREAKQKQHHRAQAVNRAKEEEKLQARREERKAYAEKQKYKHAILKEMREKQKSEKDNSTTKTP